MSLNDSMTDYERSQLAVWDYPVSDKYTKMWQAMQENKPPETFQEAVDRVRGKETKDGVQQDGFAFLGMTRDPALYFQRMHIHFNFPLAPANIKNGAGARSKL